MPRLLHVEASPRKERSHSKAVAEAFLDTYRIKHPGDEVETFDVWDADLPEFDGHAIAAKYAVMGGGDVADADREAWDRVEKLADHFKSFDKYLFSVPMWNFGIPYKLKRYIDVITQPGMLFNKDENGYTGLCVGRAVGIHARGGDYGTSGDLIFDYQKRYMDLWIKFIGLEGVENITVEPTAAEGSERAAEERSKSIEQAKKLAESF